MNYTSVVNSLVRIVHQEQLKTINKKLVGTGERPSSTAQLITMCETLNAICDVCAS